MNKNCFRTVALMAALIIGALSAMAVNPPAKTFSLTRDGIAEVRIGAEYTSVPTSCPGLYNDASFFVRCGSEDGEGVDVFYSDGTSEYIVCASLYVFEDAINAFSNKGLECCYYLITDPQINKILKSNGSTMIESITVVPSPRITVNVGGREMATSESVRKFMEVPGAITTVSMGEGLQVTCYIGDLVMTVNAYDSMQPAALERIGTKIARAMETGDYEPIEISSADILPNVKFDYIGYY